MLPTQHKETSNQLNQQQQQKLLSHCGLQIISTAVHEDCYELSLTVNFAVRAGDPADGDATPGSRTREYLSSFTRGHRSALSHYGSMDSISESAQTCIIASLPVG